MLARIVEVMQGRFIRVVVRRMSHGAYKGSFWGSNLYAPRECAMYEAYKIAEISDFICLFSERKMAEAYKIVKLGSFICFI